MTDSLQRIVAELRKIGSGKNELVILDSEDFNDYADRLERLSAAEQKVTEDDAEKMVRFVLTKVFKQETTNEQVQEVAAKVRAASSLAPKVRRWRGWQNGS